MLNAKKVLISLAALSLVLFSGRAMSQNIKLNPIKPGAKVTAQLTDEQQGILAVRSAKASVVSIIGIKAVLPSDKAALISGSPSITGTGFILSPDGYIVSNNHVVSDASYNYTVILADGKQYDAKIIGLDKFDDVALIKIDAQNLPAAKLGDSDALETGQTVFAIGNALGKYEFSVTKGVISGLGRQVEVSSSAAPRLKNLIQTDASINPGNSGGPLIDLAGEVIGMSTAIDREGESLGFAVPINIIQIATEQLRLYGKVYRPWIGVEFATITKPVQLLEKLPLSEGAWIKSVLPGGPAAIAGLKAGDIITKINSQDLSTMNELDQVVSQFTSGNQILVTYYRNGSVFQAPLILGEYK